MLDRLRAFLRRDDLTSSSIEDVVARLPVPATLPPDMPDAVTAAIGGNPEGDAEAGRATHAAHPELGSFEDRQRKLGRQP